MAWPQVLNALATSTGARQGLSPNVHEIRETILYIYAVVAVVVAFARGMRVISQSNQERAQDANLPGLLYGAYFGWNGPDIVGKPK